MTATRRELIDLLTMAAEVEHSLVCQYLFAALTLKQTEEEGLTPDQMNQVVRWERFILMVARQEMEHLGLACNLLTAVGGMPQFRHPRFPYYTPMWGHEMALLPFGEDALRRFICYERPEEIDPGDAFCVERPATVDGELPPLEYSDVGELYKRVRAVLVELADSTTDLFLEGASQQVSGVDLGTDFPRVGAMGGGYDVFLFPINNKQSALAAIDLITEQGEGGIVAGDLGHYQVFVNILEQLQAAGPFQPARNVAPNPVLYRRHGDTDVTVIDHPLSRQVLDLFMEAYNVMLLMLIRLFAHTDESATDIKQLQAAGFFPMMTMVIRPLSEVLTSLPAHPDGELRAGPSFELEPGLKFLPHSDAAWVVLGERLDQLVAKAGAVAAQPDAPARLAYIAESIELMTRRFKTELAAADA